MNQLGKAVYHLLRDRLLVSGQDLLQGKGLAGRGEIGAAETAKSGVGSTGILVFGTQNAQKTGVVVGDLIGAFDGIGLKAVPQELLVLLGLLLPILSGAGQILFFVFFKELVEGGDPFGAAQKHRAAVGHGGQQSAFRIPHFLLLALALDGHRTVGAERQLGRQSSRFSGKRGLLIVLRGGTATKGQKEKGA